MGTRQSVPASSSSTRTRDPALSHSNGWSSLVTTHGIPTPVFPPKHPSLSPQRDSRNTPVPTATGGGSSGVGGRSLSMPIPSGALTTEAGPSSAGLDSSDSDQDPRPLTLEQLIAGSRRFHRRRLPPHGLPPLAFRFFDIKCPVCNKQIPSDEAEVHLVMCLTRPRITYNEDVLSEDKGECAICFEEMNQGDTIARLPCLCVYHKGCIDSWFTVKNSCPEHPGDD